MKHLSQKQKHQLRSYTFELESTGDVYDFIPEWLQKQNYADHNKAVWRNYVSEKLDEEAVSNDQENIKRVVKNIKLKTSD